MSGTARHAAWSGSNATSRAATTSARSSCCAAPNPTGSGPRRSQVRFIARDTARLRDHLLSAWDGDRQAASVAAQVVDHGPGPLGLRLAAVNRAREELARWSIKWQPYLPDMPTRNDQVVRYAAHADNNPRIWQAFEAYAHQHAEAAHPEHAVIAATAQAADTELAHTLHALHDTGRRHAAQLNRYGSLGHTNDPDADLERLERAVTTGLTELAPRDPCTSRRPAHTRTRPVALRLRH